MTKNIWIVKLLLNSNTKTAYNWRKKGKIFKMKPTKYEMNS